MFIAPLMKQNLKPLKLILLFAALAECISLYHELPQILQSSGWICLLIHTLTAVKGLAVANNALIRAINISGR